MAGAERWRLALLLALIAHLAVGERLREERSGGPLAPPASHAPPPATPNNRARRLQLTPRTLRPRRARTEAAIATQGPTAERRGSFEFDGFCRELWRQEGVDEPASPAIGNELQACISSTYAQLKSKAETYLSLLQEFVDQKRCTMAIGEEWRVGSNKPCHSAVEGNGPHRRCILELEHIWEKTGDRAWLEKISVTVNAKRDIALAVARIGDAVPGVSDRLLAIGSGVHAAMLFRACSSSRLEYCYAIMQYPGTGRTSRVFVRCQGAQILASFLVNDCAASSTHGGCGRAKKAAPAIIAAMGEYYQAACAGAANKRLSSSKRSKCARSMSGVSALCFAEAIRGDPVATEVCDSVFAVFAIGHVDAELSFDAEPSFADAPSR